MDKIKVFISSSEKELECEREVSGDVIDNLYMNPIVYELTSARNDSPHDDYLDLIETCDIFVLILWKTLSFYVQNEYKKAIETHKPILLFLKDLKEDETRENNLNEFLSQFKNDNPKSNFRNSSWGKFRSLKTFKTKLKDSLLIEIGKAYKEPIQTLSRKQMYQVGTKLLKRAKKRLYIFQRTPSLFYINSENKTEYEKYESEFVMTLRSWIENQKDIDDVNFAYIFDVKNTKHKFESLDEETRRKYSFKFKENLNFYKKFEKNSNFKFTCFDTSVSGPLIVADNNFGMWILGKEKSISFSQENEKISTVLVKTLETEMEANIKSFDSIVKELGI